MASTMQQARRVPVPAHEPLIGTEAHDYADAFEVTVAASDARSSEAFARCALEEAAAPVRWTIAVVHRWVLGLRLAPPSSPDHVLGWKVVTSERDVVALEARSPLLGRGVIVGRRPDATRVVVATYLFYARPRAARSVWAFVGPLHRAIAPYLLARAAGARQPVQLTGVAR